MELPHAKLAGRVTKGYLSGTNRRHRSYIFAIDSPSERGHAMLQFPTTSFEENASRASFRNFHSCPSASIGSMCGSPTRWESARAQI